MIDVIKSWFVRYFSDPEAVVLAVLLIVSTTLIITWGKSLAPLVASIVIAYLLLWVVEVLRKLKVPELLSVLLVYLGFLGLFFGALLILWPMAWRQMINLAQELPNMVIQAQSNLYLLPEKFPEYVTIEAVDSLTESIRLQIRGFGRTLLSTTLSSIPNLIAIGVYLILVPLMVFFFLKDHEKIVNWGTNFLPTERPLLRKIWLEVDSQIGNYVRGKAVEVLVVTVATYFVFLWFHLPYSVLLAVLVGLSVFVPYVGGIVVTIPVVLISFFQWGFGPQFIWLNVWYLIIQVMDANILVPLLFSEAVNLHPIAIIVAIIVFGGLWGFWGIFFAIPLATLVKAVLNAWPRHYNMERVSV